MLSHSGKKGITWDTFSTSIVWKGKEKQKSPNSCLLLPSHPGALVKQALWFISEHCEEDWHQPLPHPVPKSSVPGRCSRHLGSWVLFCSEKDLLLHPEVFSPDGASLMPRGFVTAEYKPGTAEDYFFPSTDSSVSVLPRT